MPANSLQQFVPCCLKTGCSLNNLQPPYDIVCLFWSIFFLNQQTRSGCSLFWGGNIWQWIVQPNPSYCLFPTRAAPAYEKFMRALMGLDVSNGPLLRTTPRQLQHRPVITIAKKLYLGLGRNHLEFKKQLSWTLMSLMNHSIVICGSCYVLADIATLDNTNFHHFATVKQQCSVI